MAQIIVPQREDKLGKILQVGGAAVGGVAGGMSGGPVGAAQGAAQGAGTGSALAGLAGMAKGSGPSAVERRMGVSAPEAPPPENPEVTLKNAMIALQDQPPEVQQQAAPQLQAAMLRLKRGQ